jgi:hypothetical protein
MPETIILVRGSLLFRDTPEDCDSEVLDPAFPASSAISDVIVEKG